MFSSDPSVTALIRTYNSDRTLRDCLQSLESQTSPPEHVVVVDSGSTDGTLGIAKDFGAEIIHYPDEEFHYSRALNIGLEQVHTPHVLIISSHVSLPEPRTVEIMETLLQEEEDRCAASIQGMVSSPSDVGPSDVEWQLVTRQNFVAQFGGIAIGNTCNLIPRRLWEQCPFDEEIPRVEDQKWLQYYLNQGRTAVRITRPQIVYDNPFYNDTKEIRDLVTLAKYDINPSLTEWHYIWKRFHNVLSALRHGDFSGHRTSFKYNIRLVWQLLKVRLGVHRDAGSKYF